MLVRPAIAGFDLVPDPISQGSTRTFTACAELPAGWYRLRMTATSPGVSAIRKRAELFADSSKVESFEWNRDLREDVIVRLAHDTRQLRLILRHVEDTFTLNRFELKRISKARTVARAVRLKLKLLQSYNCFWPVVSRGGKLLRQGRFREFGRKLLRGIPDSRTMRIELKRAAEVSAMWWRRRALSADEVARLRLEADAIANPKPIAVLIPADETRTDHARQAILSVFRQAYPHWELVIAWPTRQVSAKLLAVANWDARVRIVRPSGDSGLSVAVEDALRSLQSDRVIVLPPDWELSEAALLRFAQANADAVTCPVPGSATDAAMLPRTLLLKQISLLEATTAVGVTRWAAARIAEASPARYAEPLLFPLDSGRAMTVIRRPSVTTTRPLVLAADIRGISGWDHVAFAVMKGLRSAGVNLHRHSKAMVCSELLPPELHAEQVERTNEPQLAVAPPFSMKRFRLDERSAAYTMWEVDRVDPAQVALLNRSRVVIVPSEWGADCLRASGVAVPLEVVPLGYDPLAFHSSRHTPCAVRGIESSRFRESLPHESGDGTRSVPTTICTFGTAGALSAGGLRKNVRRVVDLFRAAFPTHDDVRLRVKITPNCPPFEIDDDPRIEILRDSLPHADLARWNRSLTAYVNASYAEGFGLHLLEAMACGVPLISPHYSGLTQFFDESVGYVVPHRLIAANNEIYRGHWADPDDDTMIEQMRRVYHDRAEAARFGEAAAARARCFTWRDTGRKLMRVLQRYDLVEATR